MLRDVMCRNDVARLICFRQQKQKIKKMYIFNYVTIFFTFLSKYSASFILCGLAN